MLLVDDDENILTVLSMRLKAGGYRAVTAKTKAEAVRTCVDENPDVVLSDLRLDEENGLDVMEAIHGIDSGIPVLIITAHGSIPNAIEAMEKGAAGYLTKPIDRNELFAQLARCVEQRQLAEEVQLLRRAVEERAELEGIIGRSAAMKKVFELIERVAPTTTTVLVHGESGTGKELAARALHLESHRSSKPFLAVNCAALSPTLLESELFGHVKGAFTGAVRDRVGVFEQADGGTLFLDEVAELPLDLQAKLLRVLQERSFVPVGGTRTVTVDIRVVAATHQSLRQAVREGRFREDLLYRLRVVPIFLPPLRDRRGDVELLMWHFIDQANERGPRRIRRVAPEAMRALLDHPWPGNVRELLNVVQYAFAVGRGPELGCQDLPPEFREASHVLAETPPSGVPDEAERIRAALRQSHGHVGRAAELLGMSRPTFWRKRKKHGI